MKKIAIIIPCFNEQENILPMYERLKKVVKTLKYDFEFIYVNNGSTDNSNEIFTDLAKKDFHVKVLFLSRNFYKSQGAYTAGLDYTDADAAVMLDGDIQDPPELIPRFIEKWENGYEIVYGERIKRKGSLFRRVSYKLFYRIFRKFSYIKIPLDAGDFSIIDRKVIDILKIMPERNRYIRGLRAWVGYNAIGIPYTREERYKGFTTNSFYNNIEWALFAIFSFSYVPLRFITLLALCTLIGIFLLTGLSTILFFLAPGIAPRGFQSLFLAIFGLGAIQLLCFSIISEYMIIMFEEIKGRPKYIIDHVLNGTKADE